MLTILIQGTGPYTEKIKGTEDDITATMKRVNDLAGVKESDTGLAVPGVWDIQADKQALQTEEPLQVNVGVVYLEVWLMFYCRWHGAPRLLMLTLNIQST